MTPEPEPRVAYAAAVAVAVAVAVGDKEEDDGKEEAIDTERGAVPDELEEDEEGGVV